MTKAALIHNSTSPSSAPLEVFLSLFGDHHMPEEKKGAAYWQKWYWMVNYARHLNEDDLMNELWALTTTIQAAEVGERLAEEDTKEEDTKARLTALEARV